MKDDREKSIQYRWTTVDELYFLNRLGTGQFSGTMLSRQELLRLYKYAFLKRVSYQEGYRWRLQIDRNIIMEYLEGEMK